MFNKILPILAILCIFGATDVEAAKSNKYVAYFTATWCGPCQKMKKSKRF